MRLLTYAPTDTGTLCLVCNRETPYPKASPNGPDPDAEHQCPLCGIKHAELLARLERAARTSLKVARAHRTLQRAGKRATAGR